MRSENEIREKISEWMDRLNKHRGQNVMLDENIFGIIDALLWVIEDESGGEI